MSRPPESRSPGGRAAARGGTSHRLRNERLEEEVLAPFAGKSASASRRHRRPAEGRAFDYRTEYQRDRDRIVHSRAFRRLADKARSGLPDGGDSYRSGQAHAMEVSQLGRTVARALRLNEDLVEAIALGHDLGCPPLAPGGREALETILGGALRIDGFTPKALRGLGGFDVPTQSLRVVDLLEKRYDHPGLNLTDDVRAGIWKQGEPSRSLALPDMEAEGLEAGAPPSAEAQVVRLACRVAGAAGALDDLLRGQPRLVETARRLGAVRQLERRVGERPGESLFMRLNVMHRGITHLLASAAIQHSGAQLSRWAEREKIDGSERFRRRRGALPPDAVGLPDRVAGLLAEVEGFVAAESGRGRPQALERRHERKAVEALFRTFYAEPALLPDYVLLRFREVEGTRYLRDVPAAEQEREVARHYRGTPWLVRLIGDHIAGMTDSYAEAEHRRLCLGDPGGRPRSVER